MGLSCARTIKWLCSPVITRVEEISSFPGNNLRVPLPSIRPLPGSPSLHQNRPSYCGQTAFRRDTNSHLLGQSSPDSPSEGHIERDFPLCAETFVQPWFHSETGEVLSKTNSSLTLPGCSTGHNLHVSCPARGTDQSDTGSMTENARVSVKILGRNVEPLGSHEPCRSGGIVGSTFILQSPATPASSTSPPVRMEISLSQYSLGDLGWWVSSTPNNCNSQDITPPPFDLSIRTDASLLGWCAACNGTSTEGCWSVEEAEQHINCLELKGSHSSFEGIPESTNPQVISFWKWTIQPSWPMWTGEGHSVTISVPTGLGTVVLPADPRFMGDSPSFTGRVECGSRRSFEGIQHALRVDASEGCLSGHIVHHFYVPEVDLFASRLNHQLPLYVSRLLHPGALAVDAFQQNWRQWKSFIHPPVVLLPRILQKVRSDRATALLVAPDWPGQPWYAQSQLTLTGMPYSLSKEKSLQSLPFDQEAVHPLWRFLIVWPILGQPTRRQVSPKRRLMSSKHNGPSQPRSVTTALAGHGPIDVLPEACAPSQHQSQMCLTERVTNQCLEYRTLAVYKSDISQGHLRVGQTLLGELLVVSRFMKGIFRMKPPTPRLSSTWDVKRLLESLATLEPPAGVTLKMLSLKLAALLAFTSSARVHE